MSIQGARHLIDPRGQRFGAALSALLLVSAYVFAFPLVVALVAAALGVSALYGTRYSALGRSWPMVRDLLRLGSPREREPEFGPRFAQAIGALVLVVGLGGRSGRRQRRRASPCRSRRPSGPSGSVP